MPQNEVTDLWAYRQSFQRAPTSNLQTGDGGGTLEGMNERISRLEGAHDGLKQSQGIMVAAIAVVSAVLIGVAAVIVALQVYGLQRADTQFSAVSDQIAKTHDEVNRLPAQIETRLQNVTNTLSTAITAAKQQPPQVILLPMNATTSTPAPQRPSK